MAGLNCVKAFGPVAMAASTDKCCVQVTAPTNQRLRIGGYKIFFVGALGTDTQILVKLVQQSSAGSGGTSGVGDLRERSCSETPQATTIIGAFSGLPTAGVTQDQSGIFPQGTLEASFPPDGPGSIIVKGGERIGLVANQGASTSTAITAYGEIYWEE